MVKKLIFMLCAATLMPLHGFAQDITDDDETQPVLKESRYAPDVTYLIGGVGEEFGKAYIESVQKQYALKLIFSTKDGRYLSRVAVLLADRNNNPLIDTVAEGPFMLVNLPAGQYILRISSQGVTKRKDVTISGKSLKTVHFHFEDEE